MGQVGSRLDGPPNLPGPIHALMHELGPLAFYYACEYAAREYDSLEEGWERHSPIATEQGFLSLARLLRAVAASGARRRSPARYLFGDAVRACAHALGDLRDVLLDRMRTGESLERIASAVAVLALEPGSREAMVVARTGAEEHGDALLEHLLIHAIPGETARSLTSLVVAKTPRDVLCLQLLEVVYGGAPDDWPRRVADQLHHGDLHANVDLLDLFGALARRVDIRPIMPALKQWVMDGGEPAVQRFSSLANEVTLRRYGPPHDADDAER